MKEQLEDLIKQAEGLLNQTDSVARSQLERIIPVAKSIVATGDTSQFVFQIAELQRGIRALAQMQTVETKPSRKKRAK